MVLSSLTEALSPPELVESVVTRSLTGFLAIHGEVPLLLVRVAEEDTELAAGLGGLTAAGGAAAEPMQFHTVVQTREDGSAPRAAARPEDPGAIAELLGRAHHFALPLRKREQADGMSSDRISVGRARNKDFVLRHVSVSKFHAWFEVDAKGGFSVTDAGSKNLTRVNGEALPPREQKHLEPGDRIRFGNVECVLCSPETLWHALRGASARPG